MYCRNCGKKIEDGSAVCPFCGEVLREEGGSRKVSAGGTEKKGLPVVPLILLLVFAVMGVIGFLILCLCPGIYMVTVLRKEETQ